MGLGVWRLGSWTQGLGFRVQGSGFRVLGLTVYGLGFRYWHDWIDGVQFNTGGAFSGKQTIEHFGFIIWGVLAFLKRRFPKALERNVVKIGVGRFGLRVVGRTGILGLTASSNAGEKGGQASGTCVGVDDRL